MYGADPMFGPKLLLIVTIAGVLMYSFELGLRKWLKVEKRKFFSYNHVNAKHKKIDWTIRISFIVLLFIGFGINIERDFEESLWYWEPWFLLMLLIVVTETVQAIMEWKFAENRRAFIVTLGCLFFSIILFITAIKTDFFWML